MKQDKGFEYLEELKNSIVDQPSAVSRMYGYCSEIARTHPEITYTALEVAELLKGLFEIGMCRHGKSPAPTTANRS